jgi:hypothetical protein
MIIQDAGFVVFDRLSMKYATPRRRVCAVEGVSGVFLFEQTLCHLAHHIEADLRTDENHLFERLDGELQGREEVW